MSNHSEYAIGTKYIITANGREIIVLKHGFLSIQVSGLLENSNLPTWVGTNEMLDWLKTGQVKKHETP